ncbi:interferon regulatory factor 8 [Sminthopsis crassicaudata]|uniref:interferon regulatory factor 8 n=1 Tax=Sminthopsis crassicaudata TaxID=9301 RepID=UPI003D6893C4
MPNSSSSSEVADMNCSRSELEDLMKEPLVDEYLGIIKRSPSPQEACRSQPVPDWWIQQSSTAMPLMTGYPAYESHHPAYSLMVISFYYGGKLMGHTTTSYPEGCRISLSLPPQHVEKMYGSESLELICFPPADFIQNDRQKQVTKKLFGHLERGVLLHSNKNGVFIKRLCQGRVFCSGNSMMFKDRPNKLERDEVVKIFDTNQFFRELQQFYNNQSQFPDSRVMLCFGEEFPDMTPLRSKLILVQVEQLYVKKLRDDIGKNCSNGLMLQTPEDIAQSEQIFRFQDICGPHQRPFFRENQQITV